jgi:putative ABC transport system substrate-binding protein
VNRRQIITLLGGTAAWPLAALRRIGVLMGVPENDLEYQTFAAAFRGGLLELGWAEGRNIQIDTRWAGPDVASIQRFAKELIALQPDLIISQSTPTTTVLKQQTSTVPIIFVNVVDPVGSGFVASFPRPGGNVTVRSRPHMAHRDEMGMSAPMPAREGRPEEICSVCDLWI